MSLAPISMNDAACLKNLTGCLGSMGLKLCDIDEDICLQHGLCITSIIPSSISRCICYPCYYGDTCEKELVSRNLWFAGLPIQKLEMNNAYRAFWFLYAVIRLINYSLCLQTYFSSRKIRITNIGVYLIFSSIIAVLISLEQFISGILFLCAERLPESYWRISCLLEQKFLMISLFYIWQWSVFCIAFERMLVECYHYSLFDSRKRSFIISTFVFIVCPLTTIPGIFTVKNLLANEVNPQVSRLLIPVSCVNYTSLGYTIFKVIFSLHGYGTLLSYMILCVVVFAHLYKHRKSIAPNCTSRENIRLILRNHRDFFIALLVPTVCTMPIFVINEIMTCSQASKFKSLPYLILVFGNIIGLLPLSFAFFFYIYPANVYMVAFWDESPVGRCLRALKRKTFKFNRTFKNILLTLTPISRQPLLRAKSFRQETTEIGI